jgi:hypothetical protein
MLPKALTDMRTFERAMNYRKKLFFSPHLLSLNFLEAAAAKHLQIIMRRSEYKKANGNILFEVFVHIRSLVRLLYGLLTEWLFSGICRGGRV